VVAAPTANDRKVMDVEGVMPEKVSLFGRKSQQLLALGRGQQLATGHKGLLENHS
jgi:hypothetical protein